MHPRLVIRVARTYSAEAEAPYVCQHRAELELGAARLARLIKG